MQNKRFSKQREAIIRYLAGTTSHPTAEDIYAAVRKEYPRMGIATVYRNLNRLCADGDIMRIDCGTSDRFDYRTSDHGHFTCTSCGRVYDVFMDFDKFAELTEEMPGEVKRTELMFYGICRHCLNKE